MDFLQQLHTLRTEISQVSVSPDSRVKLSDFLSTLDHLIDVVIPYTESVLVDSTSIKVTLFQMDERWWKTIDSILCDASYLQHWSKHTEPFDRLCAVVYALKQWAIEQVFDDDITVDDLVAMLDSPNDHIRIEAVMRLHEYPTVMISIIPDLIRTMIEANNHILRVAIVRTLATVSDAAVPHLTAILANGNFGRQRRWTMFALARMGVDALEAIIEAWPTADDDFRWAMVALLGNYHEYPEIVMPLLLEALESTDSRICIEALETLDYFAPFASDAVPILETLIHEQRHPIDSRFIMRRIKYIQEAR